MKATELMVKDWVFLTQNGVKIPLKVVFITSESEYCHLEGEMFSGTVWGERISPIPITPKILEKNGFVYDGHIIGSDGYDCKSYNINDSQVWGYLAKEGFDIAFGGHNQPSGIILPFVHQLQHALRLCGLKDLADNFKI